MNLRIRTGVVKDAAALSSLALRSKAVWGYSNEFIEGCRDELRVTPDSILDRSMRYFVADSDHMIVGFSAVKRVSSDQCELEALFVLPEFIGMGVGKRLMNKAIDYARKESFRRMLIDGDPNAEKFYVAAGGTRIGEVPSGSIKGRMLPLFEINLEERS